MRLLILVIFCIQFVRATSFAQTTSVGSENLPEIRLKNPTKVDQIIHKVLPKDVFEQLQLG
ncbi:hypothetical protein [Microscilla marina]|uniref:Uncharacterized protein n=1 Tax=Microscilla marina ATCC 23134 TaxID=313606 RepID=A1ZUJ4_MICM2|nr:hypothetical protein [Microscilla marina]EAY26013.1 hypothetical protein M23134_07162 [Microscilla marina ATCC 23134]